MPETQRYLGDGVYAIYDGFGVWLHANDHRPEYATDKIYLEPTVFEALDDFRKKLREDYKRCAI